jgi:FixJ family two-component response regulator
MSAIGGSLHRVGNAPHSRHPSSVSHESERVVVAVDDDESMRRVLGRVLEWRGFRAVLLRGREATVERVLEHDPVVVLLDYELGARTAVDFAIELAARGDVPPLVLVSAAADRLTRAESARFAALHVKPFRALELLDDVQRLAEKRRDTKSSGVRPRSEAILQRRRVEGE